jgi:arginase
MLFLFNNSRVVFMQRRIEFIINKSEIVAGTRGASLGPEAIITAGRKKGSNLFASHPLRWIQDQNYRLDQPVKYPNAKKIEGLLEVFKLVSSEVKSVYQLNGFPIVLAGDHGSAGGTIAGVKSAFPDKRLGVIWIDAHGDLHTPFTTPSGNMHGMPLSTVLAIDNLKHKRNEVQPDVIGFWNDLKNIGVPGAKIKPEDLVFIGVRDTEEEEDALIKELNITNHKVEDVRASGTAAIIERTLVQLKDCDLIYVSFDVDVMDPQETSHGTGTPVENGITIQEAQELLRGFAASDKIAAIEFVEVNPCLDEKVNRMAEIAFDFVDDVVKILSR